MNLTIRKCTNIQRTSFRACQVTDRQFDCYRDVLGLSSPTMEFHLEPSSPCEMDLTATLTMPSPVPSPPETRRAEAARHYSEALLRLKVYDLEAASRELEAALALLIGDGSEPARRLEAHLLYAFGRTFAATGSAAAALQCFRETYDLAAFHDLPQLFEAAMRAIHYTIRMQPALLREAWPTAA